jgi:hypothetical protein
MATESKLIPSATNLSNLFYGVKLYSKNVYRQPGKIIGKYSNIYTDVVDFVASIYAKELAVANSNATWNYKLADGSNQTSAFSPDQGIHYETLGMIVAVSEFEWNELQQTISKALNIIRFPNAFHTVNTSYSLSDMLYFYRKMGVFSGGTAATLSLTDANGNPLPGSPFAQGVTYATAWNTVKVPADLALGITTPYIAPVYNPTPVVGDEYFYRFTGVRVWESPFAGYDAY